MVGAVVGAGGELPFLLPLLLSFVSLLGHHIWAPLLLDVALGLLLSTLSALPLTLLCFCAPRLFCLPQPFQQTRAHAEGGLPSAYILCPMEKTRQVTARGAAGGEAE